MNTKASSKSSKSSKRRIEDDPYRGYMKKKLKVEAMKAKADLIKAKALLLQQQRMNEENASGKK